MSSKTTTTAGDLGLTEDQIREAAAKLGLRVQGPKTERSRPAPFAEEDTERLAWITENARPAEGPCLCGCGQLTKGRFVPGHDAILKSRLAQTPGPEARAAEVKFGWPSKEPEVKAEETTEAS